MIAEKASDAIGQAVCYELQNIVKNYGAVYASSHEAYAVLKEETGFRFLLIVRKFRKSSNGPQKQCL